jgi:glycosyltransferase involved in cell wall biosynthesis
VSVLGTLATDDSRGLPAPLDVLNATDVAIIQHEYGLYGGHDGAEILDTMAGIVVPTIVVAHTVVSSPTANQRHVLEQACTRADAVVVMTETARTRLTTCFDVKRSKVVVIPHGAATPPALAPRAEPGPTDRGQRVLTWGLLGPGKGIEWAIDAMADLADLRPLPHYIIAGATHPKVLARSGQSYRQMLVHRATSSAAAAHVSFDDTYRDLASLTDLIRSADLVVLPYDSTDQVTSGVLVDAVAAGRPVVSTAFPHAVELLESGAGLVVPQRDSAALAAAIRSVLTNPDLAASMAAEARRLAPDLSWTAVAGRYDELAGHLLAGRQPVRP